MRLFGTSGIRGEVFKRITPELCVNLGKAIASSLPERSDIAVATDARVTKDILKSALISGLLTGNVNVTDVGIAPTPVLAFLTKRYDTGVMITASHNPPEYNGIKLWRDGMAYTVHDEQQIEDALLWQEYRMPTWDKIGTLRVDYEAKKAHADEILKRIALKRHFKVVVDPGNGAASGYASGVFKNAGLDVLAINDEPDGLFPHRSSEPTAETVKEAISYLRKEDADIAVCFDGDADRVVFCDKKGFIGYNEAISFISRLKISREREAKKVVTTVETGRLLDYAIEGVGGEVIRGKVGDGYVGHGVKKAGAAIGVELVGVYIMPELGYYPDSMYAALYLLANIEKVSEIRAFLEEMPTLYFDKEGVPVDERAKYEVMERVHAHLDVSSASIVNSSDGLRLDLGDTWVLIRASGTQPLIRVIAESRDRKELDNVMDRGVRAVTAAKKELK
mgnify:CR=1 FL=1